MPASTSPDRSSTASDPQVGPEKKRWWRRKRFWFLLVFFLSLYPVLMTLALWTGLVERLVRSEDLRVEIDNPAYSIIPGQIHAAGVHIYLNGVPQFILEAENIGAHIRLLPLLRKRFSLSWLGAKNVSYRMRLPQEEGADEAPRTKAFPPLEGLPGTNSVSKEEAQEDEEQDSLWTVELRNLNVTVRELWFFEYHYVGEGALRGGFERGPDVLRVDTSVQGLGPGKLYYGRDQVISHNFRGRVEAHIPRVNPREHADLSFFDFVHGDIELKADVEHLEHVSAYVPDVEITEGGGPLYIRLKLKEGVLSDNTLISYETEELNLKTAGFGLKTDWSTRVTIDSGPEGKGEPRPHMESKSKVSYLSFSVPKKPSFTIQLHNHVESIGLASMKIDEDIDVDRASIDLPKIISTDFDDVDSLTGDTMQAERGEATANIRLTMNDKKDFLGNFQAQFSGFNLEIDPVQADIDAKARASLLLSLKNKQFVVSDLVVDLNDIDFLTNKKRINDWWCQIKSPQIALGWGTPQTTKLEVVFVAKDAEPVLRALAAEDKVPEIVPALIKLRDIRSRAELRQRGENLDVMIENLDTRFMDFSGRIFSTPDEQVMALLIGGKAVSLGIFRKNEKNHFQPFAHAAWLNERLKEFPQPKERVDGQKP